MFYHRCLDWCSLCWSWHCKVCLCICILFIHVLYTNLLKNLIQFQHVSYIFKYVVLSMYDSIRPVSISESRRNSWNCRKSKASIQVQPLVSFLSFHFVKKTKSQIEISLEEKIKICTFVLLICLFVTGKQRLKS